MLINHNQNYLCFLERGFMMNADDLRQMFMHMDNSAAFFRVILNPDQTINDIIVEDFNDVYLKNSDSRFTKREQLFHTSYLAEEPHLDPRWAEYIYRAAVQRQHVHGELRNSELYYWLEFSGGPAATPNTCWMVYNNQTKYKNANEELTVISYFDELTGVKNRNAFRKAMHDFKQQHVPLGVIMIDANGLKASNDQHGHAAGDQLIKDVADFLSSLVPKTLPYRAGGDEFVFILENYSKVQCQKIQKQIEECQTLSLSCGVGWTADSATIEDTFKQADLDMYKDKKAYYQKHERRHV